MDSTSPQKSATPRVSQISNGKTKLQRTCQVFLNLKEIDKTVKTSMLNELQRQKTHGFRKGSKVVPPAYRKANEVRILFECFYQVVPSIIAEKLIAENIKFFPSIEIHNYETIEGEYVVECSFEVRPDVPEPEIKSLKLRKPIPEVSDAEVEKIIQRILRQKAKFKPVDRAAKLTDRIQFFEASAPDNVQNMILGDPSPFSKIQSEFIDKKINDKIIIKDESINNETNSLEFTLSLVEEAEVPELNLDFARQLFPEVGSVDAFKDQVKNEINSQAKRMATSIMINRALFSLDQNTKDFDLPENIIERSFQNEMASLEDRIKNAKSSKEKLGIKDEKIRDDISKEIRQSLIINCFVENNKLSISDQEYNQYAQELAIQSQDAVAYMQQLKDSEDAKNQLRNYVLRNKISDKLYEQVTVEEVKMTLDELERIIHKGDPETRNIQNSA